MTTTAPLCRTLSRPLTRRLNRQASSAPLFESVWDTRNISPGSTNATSIKIPTVADGSYDCLVDWSDGTTDHITAWDDPAWDHDYPAGGVKTIRIAGTFVGLKFGDSDTMTTDRYKILRVTKWGQNGNGLTSANDAFRATPNLISVGVPDLSGITSLATMFFGSGVNQPIANWPTAGITNMAYMLGRALNFDQDLSELNISNVLSLDGLFFDRVGVNKISTAMLDSIYQGWSTRPVQPGLTLDVGDAQYSPESLPGRTILASAPNNWTLIDGGVKP